MLEVLLVRCTPNSSSTCCTAVYGSHTTCRMMLLQPTRSDVYVYIYIYIYIYPSVYLSGIYLLHDLGEIQLAALHTEARIN